MIRILFIILILSFNLHQATCQALTFPVGGAAIACGHTSLCRGDIWSGMNNQAACVETQKWSTGIYMSNSYMLPELNRIALISIIPLKHTTFSINIDHFGGALYSEMKSGIAIARSFGEDFSVGLQLDHLMMSIGEGHGTYHCITFEIGTLAVLTEKIKIGLHAFNPINAKWIGTEEHIPVLLRGGFAYSPERSLEIYAEVHKSTANDAVICAGMNYNYRNTLQIRAGITSGPARYTFGVGLILQRLTIDIASSVHAWLGYSPQLSFTYQIGK